MFYSKPVFFSCVSANSFVSTNSSRSTIGQPRCARSYAPFLAWATAVVGHWRDIFDRFDINAGGLKRRYGALPTATGTIHPDVYILDTEFQCLLGCLLRRWQSVQPFYVHCGLTWQTAELAAARRFLHAIRDPRLAPLVLLDLPVQDSI